jgi:hypothetical protein
MVIPELALAIVLLVTAPALSRSSANEDTDARALILMPSPFGQTVVRYALDLAEAKLDRPGCRDIYAEFVLADGGTPQGVLDSMRIGPRSLLEHLVFMDGSRDPVCAAGRAGLTTSPGSFVIRVCPRFIPLYVHNPPLSAILILHESLHVLGLAEDRPTSGMITQEVEWRCWKNGNPKSR